MSGICANGDPGPGSSRQNPSTFNYDLYKRRQNQYLREGTTGKHDAVAQSGYLSTETDADPGDSAFTARSSA